MPRLRFVSGFLLTVISVSCASSAAAPDAPDAKPQAAPAAKVGKLPHVTFDAKKKQVRVECEALGVDAPLEFFCVQAGGSEHESVLRTPAKASDIHTALLAIGLQPGRPTRYSESLNKWLPPEGPPLHVTLEWEKDGKTVSVPAYRTMRTLDTKKEMKPLTWVYCGSRLGPDGQFGADITGYVVSIVNFDLTLIDIPEVASNSNETLEWQRNPDVAPPQGTKVIMVIEPAAKQEDENKKEGKGKKQGDAKVQAGGGGGERYSDVELDTRRMDQLRERWLSAVRPHAAALRDAARAHYEVVAGMRREQQRLIDEADRLQRSIDALEKEWQDLTAPRPATQE